jgi:hypothetical protein
LFNDDEEDKEIIGGLGDGGGMVGRGGQWGRDMRGEEETDVN